MTWRVLAVLALAAVVAVAGEPVFDPATLMRLVLVPADAAVGSVIYRVRASDPDFDYPLHFELIGQMGRLDIGVETLPCTRYNSVCQANVILLRRLEPGRYVDFRLSARNTRGRSARIACSVTGTNATTPRDTIFPHQPGIIIVPEVSHYLDSRLSARNTCGRSARIACSVTGTNATTPRDTIFPHQPGIIIVPEDAKRGTDLEIVIARKNPLSPKPLELELWGSPLFAIRQRRVSTENTEGTIFLVGPLDFEAQSMYHLTLLAVDPYVELGKDTRNIAALEVVVVVQDVQDMPPVFTSAPPITHLPRQVVPGDMVVRVRAEDGDKGAPRQIRYGLVSEGNPFTPFFNINETTGEVTLERPIEEIAAISHAGAPILLTVVAEEVRLSREEPEAMSSTVQLAFILPERDNSPPYFENESYIAYLDENAPQGTAIVFNDPYMPQVNDNDAGKNGVFSLSLLGNNGTFEITPTVAERHAQFIIKVRDNTMLDFEARKSVVFQILAQELGPATNLSATVNVTVYLNDVNDNAPVFLALSYDVELPENITAGAKVVQVAADDVDTGNFGKIQYTAILGYLNTSLNLDPITGVITVATNNHGFDREAMPDLHFLVEARDNDGVGLRVTVPLIIKLLDVNDNPPEFERSVYEFVLSPNLNNFTSPAFVKAIDKDAEAPNNVVRYEIIHGNTEKFAINEETGELYLLESLKRTKKQNRRKRESQAQDSEVFVLTVRAYDLGIPRLSSTTTVKVYPPESKTRTMSFIVPGANPDRKKLEEVLSTLSGGRVTIVDIKPYKGKDNNGKDIIGDDSSQERSEVIALVHTASNNAIDVTKLQEQLAKNKMVYTTGSGNRDQTSTSFEDNNSNLYKAESRLLFWLLILLAILIALVLLLLICCCICEGCPLYMPPRKRVIRVNSTEDDVHLVVRDKGVGRENKSTQNIESKLRQSPEWKRREAWSAEQADLRTKPTQWKFNKRNYRSKDHSKPASTPGDLRHEFIQTAADNDYKYDDTRQSFRQRDGPNIIYTKEMQLQDAVTNKHKEYIEDLENGYDRIATLHYQHKEQDDDSIRRHEIDRGSDVGVILKSEASKNKYDKGDSRLQRDYQGTKQAASSFSRDHLFIKEGNTEILRLVTRGNNEEERYVNLSKHQQRPVTLVPHTQYVVIDSGKDMLMERFIREQGEEAKQIRDKMQEQVTDLDNVSNDKDEKSIGPHSRTGSNIQNKLNDYTNLPDVPGIVPLKSEYLQSALLEMQNKSSIQQELLESSLRKQNELLHQILIERERILQNQETASQVESKLETQSLPGHSVMATQTECHIGTQTEPQLLNDVKRKSRSDNDSYSEDDSQSISEEQARKLAWLKKKKPRKKSKYKDPKNNVQVYELKRKIKTPILEESDISPSLESESRVRISKVNEREEHIKNYGNITKSTITTSKNETLYSTETKPNDSSKKAKLDRDVLLEISDSLEDISETKYKNKSKLKRRSLIENKDFSKKALALEHRNSVDIESTSSSSSKKNQEIKEVYDPSNQLHVDEPNAQFTTEDSNVTALQTSTNLKSDKDVSLIKSSEKEPSKISDGVKPPQKSLPRYMQWYSKKTTSSSKGTASEKDVPEKPKRPSKSKSDQEKEGKDKNVQYGKILGKDVNQSAEVKKNFKEKESEFIHPRLLKEERVTPIPEGPLPDAHPLLQHSEHRYEHQYENQNPLCHIQPTHIPKYFGNQPVTAMPRQKSQEPQPIYANQEDTKSKKIVPDLSESALTHSISISANYGDGKKPAQEVHVSKINIGGDTVETGQKNATKLEDNDSGIAMSTLVQQTGNIKRLPITEKKSVFTIAYDDVHTKQLRPDSSSTSY